MKIATNNIGILLRIQLQSLFGTYLWPLKATTKLSQTQPQTYSTRSKKKCYFFLSSISRTPKLCACCGDAVLLRLICTGEMLSMSIRNWFQYDQIKREKRLRKRQTYSANLSTYRSPHRSKNGECVLSTFRLSTLKPTVFFFGLIYPSLSITYHLIINTISSK